MFRTLFLALILCLNACSHVPKNHTPKAVPPQSVDVVIVGAGLSGLVTAYELQKLGMSYHLLELSPYVGGRVKTATYTLPSGEILSADSGMEEYWESNPIVPMFQELGLNVRGDLAASSVQIGDRIYGFTADSNTENLNRLFSPAEKKELGRFKAAVESLLSKPYDLKLKEISFGDWVKKRVSSKKVQEWIRLSVECEAGTSWNAFSALDGMAEFSIFLGDGQKSYRIRGGNQKLTERLLDRIGIEHVSTNHRVTRIQNDSDSATVHYFDITNNAYRSIKSKAVVSTVPPFRLVMEVQIEPALNAEKMQAIQTMTYGSYFKAHVFVPNLATNHYWHQNGKSILPIITDSELGVIYDGNPDHTGPTKILSLLVYGSQAEAFNFMNQDQVHKLIAKRFETILPGFSGQIQRMEFHRYHPRAIASWPVGRSRFDSLSDALRAPENRLILAGDFTEGSHSSDAVKSAFRAVKAVQAVLKRAQ